MEPLTAVVCMVAALALGYRLASHWDDTGTLVHLLGVLLIASVLLASGVTAASPGADTLAQHLVLLLVLWHGVLCIVVAAFWPVLQFRFTVPLPRPRPKGTTPWATSGRHHLRS